MIETTAIFFAVVAISFFVSFLEDDGLKNSAGFVGFIVLSVLQKATTGLPVLAMMAVIYLFHEASKSSSVRNVFSVKNFFAASFMFGVPLVVGAAWTVYTDLVKAENEFGVQLTSGALSKWNWGTVAQRMSAELYGTVLWGRIFKENLSGVLGVAVILSGLAFASERKIKIILIVSFLLGVLPVFIFSNLHIVHSYYQSANAMFFIFALAVSLVAVFDGLRSKGVLLIFSIALVVSNYIAFAGGYFKVLQEVYTVENSREIKVSEILKRSMGHDQAFVAYGNDWSSSFAYLSERKSFTVPGWFEGYSKVLLSPEKYLGGYSLGAVVLCPVTYGPTVRQLIEWSKIDREWKVVEVSGCYISLPEGQALNLGGNVEVASCQGSLDYVGTVGEDTPRAVKVMGWTTISAEENLVPERVYVTLTDAAGVTSYEAVQYPRPDVSKFFGRPELGNSGFGRILDTSSLAGEYVVSIARLYDGRVESCQFREKLRVNN